MILRRVFTTAVAAVLVWPILPVCAAPNSFGVGSGIDAGDGKILDVDATRQLTLREGVQAYQFSPSGEKIAFVSLVDDHGVKDLVIKVVDTWRREPEVQTLAKQQVMTGEGGERKYFNLELVGWAGDDRYVLFHRLAVSMAGGPEISQQIEMADLSAAPPDPGPLPGLPKFADEDLVSWDYAWSPAHDRLLLARNSVLVNDADLPKEPRYFLYDPAGARTQEVKGASTDAFHGWLDDARLSLIRLDAAKKPEFWEYDLAAGAFTVSKRPEWWQADSDQKLMSRHSFEPSSVDPKDPTLQIDTVTHQLASTLKDALAPASTLWVRRSAAGGKFAVFPLAVVPGADLPLSQWSPTGKAVAYVAHGDLFLANLGKRPATALEKLALGEKLSCEEEKLIGASQVKQIGLGILMYSQDNDDKYPLAAGFQQTIAPYLKDSSLFTLGDSKFVYHAPANLALASIENPSNTVLGEMETPCAHIVLYADGHVKAIDK